MRFQLFEMINKGNNIFHVHKLYHSLLIYIIPTGIFFTASGMKYGVILL